MPLKIGSGLLRCSAIGSAAGVDLNRRHAPAADYVGQEAVVDPALPLPNGRS